MLSKGLQQLHHLAVAEAVLPQVEYLLHDALLEVVAGYHPLEILGRDHVELNKRKVLRGAQQLLLLRRQLVAAHERDYLRILFGPKQRGDVGGEEEVPAEFKYLALVAVEKHLAVIHGLLEHVVLHQGFDVVGGKSNLVVEVTGLFELGEGLHHNLERLVRLLISEQDIDHAHKVKEVVAVGVPNG